MLSERAFRAQLVTQGQRELYDYWRETAGFRRDAGALRHQSFQRSEASSLHRPDRPDARDLPRHSSDWRAPGSATSTGKRSPASGSTGFLPALARTIGGTSTPGSWERVRRSTAWSADRPRPRPYRLVLAAIAALAGRVEVDRILCYDTAAPTEAIRGTDGRRPHQASGAAATGVDRAAAGAVRLGRNFARRIKPKLGFVRRHQPKVTIELVAPMAGKRTPALGTQGAPQLR